KGCRNQLINAVEAEKWVWEQVTKMLLQPDNIKAAYKQSLADHNRKNASKIKTLENLLTRKNNIIQQQDRLNRNYLKQEFPMSLDEMKRQKIALDNELSGLEQAIENIRSEMANGLVVIPEGDIDKFFEETKEFLLSDEPTDEEKQNILHFLNITVYVDVDGNLSLSGWFNIPAQVNKTSR